MRYLLAPFVAASLIVSPTGALAAPVERAPSSVAESEGISGASPILIIVLVAVVLGLALALSAGGDEAPVSP